MGPMKSPLSSTCRRDSKQRKESQRRKIIPARFASLIVVALVFSNALTDFSDPSIDQNETGRIPMGVDAFTSKSFTPKIPRPTPDQIREGLCDIHSGHKPSFLSRGDGMRQTSKAQDEPSSLRSFSADLRDSQQSERQTPRSLLSPNHLLYPDTFHTFDAPLNGSVPMLEGFRLMKQSIETFLAAESKTMRPAPLWESSSILTDPKVLRIEQKISHNVEPLCWLQAQMNNRNPLALSVDQPAFYMETADENMEAAVFGSSRTHRGRLEEDSAWMDELPRRARVYGGSRFDSERKPSDEWKAFSRGFWVLPAVEVRRESECESFEEPERSSTRPSTTTLAIHLVRDASGDFEVSARHVLSILEGLTDESTPAIPPTTIPPILSRSSTYQRLVKKSSDSTSFSRALAESSVLSEDAQEIYERGVAAAVEEFSETKKTAFSNRNNSISEKQEGKESSALEKVVLARRLDLQFDPSAEDDVTALDILRKWKYASRPGGHLIYLCPNMNGDYEFFGCTPERLFQVVSTPGSDHNQNATTMVVSEALAGTRPRGSTPEADKELSRQLFASAKDQSENEITGRFIMQAFNELDERGWIKTASFGQNSTAVEEKGGMIEDYAAIGSGGTIEGRFYLRRLRHLQHICQQFQFELASSAVSKNVTEYLLQALHPTPAVGGYPKDPAIQFIRRYESNSFDRGFYAGPFGFVGRGEAEIVVAIRSALIARGKDARNQYHLLSSTIERKEAKPKVSVYAGAGLVPGSTVQDEWAETSYKLGVVSSIFPQSPFTLQNAITPNSAWATAFVEELVRNGVTQFYICPGSRSTPLVAAIAKIVRSNFGVVQALSVHDERGAAFRALGYARGVGRPAAVITSSGTAVANLYPAIIEAGMDAVPMIILTADRPYESRDTGANQAIDQVKVYSESYVRWFRDILPPHDDVPISVALADAAQGVNLSRRLKGPVHLNVQFRENLAPDAGPIRNDGRTGSVTTFDSLRFTDSPGYSRWSLGGGQWVKSSFSSRNFDSGSFFEIIRLIMESKRGMIVVGNVRKSSDENQACDPSRTAQLINDFAQSIGFPIFAGIQSGNLRFESSAVVLFGEHLLRSPLVNENLKPDLVIQLGGPLISTEIPSIIKKMTHNGSSNHVLVHSHHPTERHNPDFTMSRILDSDIDTFLIEAMNILKNQEGFSTSSQLAPIVNLGRLLQQEMPSIVDQAGATIRDDDSDFHGMTEPEVVLSLSRMLTAEGIPDSSIFLSNSMPVRDSEAFLYPTSGNHGSRLKDIAVNRGASGIDGVIASAAGFADSTKRPTSLLIGDVAALHDINSLHSLRATQSSRDNQASKDHPLTTIVLNNDGGGIFSFLPIAKHGSDVSFEEFFGTPTGTFSFEKGAQAFNLPFARVESTECFEQAYEKSVKSEDASIIEVTVATREKNVLVHKEISSLVNKFLSETINADISKEEETETLPVRHSRPRDFASSGDSIVGDKVMVLLHGWMGDTEEWNNVESDLLKTLPDDWSILNIDLPGHGRTRLRGSSFELSIQETLGLVGKSERPSVNGFGIDEIAMSVYRSLKAFGVSKVDTIAGYSLGGRVALAMKRLSMISTETSNSELNDIVDDETKMVLISTYPGEMTNVRRRSVDDIEGESIERLLKDERLASEIENLSHRNVLAPNDPEETPRIWSELVNRWYSAPLWGNLRKEKEYADMAFRRTQTLSKRGIDVASVLRQCSPPRCSSEDWRGVTAKNTLFIAGELDKKYSSIGRQWCDIEPTLGYLEVPRKGHALLIEASKDIAAAIEAFSLQERSADPREKHNDTKIWEAKLIPSLQKDEPPAEKIETPSTTSIGSLDFESFAVNLVNDKAEEQGVSGVGWGLQAKPKNDNVLKKRSGYIVQVASKNGLHVGIGEVSPLKGLHAESFEEAGEQLESIANRLSEIPTDEIPPFDAEKIVKLDGALGDYIDSLNCILSVGDFYASVRSGLEMAILSLCSSKLRIPIHSALVSNAPNSQSLSPYISTLPLNGLITRNQSSATGAEGVKKHFSSWKVKIGHQSIADDVKSVEDAFLNLQVETGGIRADANRAFDETSYSDFAEALKNTDISISGGHIEYIEEPIRKQIKEDEKWSLENQVVALERTFATNSIPYALDESIFDLLMVHNNDFTAIKQDLLNTFGENSRGCAAIILKPSLLGLELSLRLARFVRSEFEMGAVFTSSFDSGVGLAYTSFLATVSDASQSTQKSHQYPHGLGTFDLMSGDIISPSFGSYVSERGVLNVGSLSRAFFGLDLNEIQSVSLAQLSRDLPSMEDSIDTAERSSNAKYNSLDEFEASTSASSTGRDIVLVASLPLPFSADIACSRFTDLPQIPRWSPWLASVAYMGNGKETEWTLRVRGVSFRWRARSELVDFPYKGIRWESTSGVKNKGVVQFIPSTDNPSTCSIKVQMAFVVPRLLASLFRGTIIEDFLRNKIMKWSLEMFRDVVKGDLALEEGNLELGDALFGAVEGKASAIEASLASSSTDED